MGVVRLLGLWEISQLLNFIIQGLAEITWLIRGRGKHQYRSFNYNSNAHSSKLKYHLVSIPTEKAFPVKNAVVLSCQHRVRKCKSTWLRERTEASLHDSFGERLLNPSVWVPKLYNKIYSYRILSSLLSMEEKDTFFRTKNSEGYLIVHLSIDTEETTPRLSGLKQQSFLRIPQRKS